MDPLLPAAAPLRPENLGSYVSLPVEAERIPGPSEFDRLRAELTLARRYAPSGRLSEASDIVARLTKRLGRYATRSDEGLHQVSDAGMRSSYTGKPRSNITGSAEPADAAALAAMVTKVRLLTGSAWAVQGDVQDRAGDHESARDAYVSAVRSFEGVERVALDGHELSDFGMALLGTDRPGDAVNALHEAAERGAWTAQTFRYLGLALLRNKVTDEAEAYLGRAVELDPDDPWLLSDRAGAIAAGVNSGQETAQDAAAAYCDAATRHAAAGRTAAALADFNRALESDSDYAPALAGKTAALVAAGRLEEGLATAELGLRQTADAVAESEPQQAGDAEVLRTYRAEALRLMGRYDEALAQVDELLGRHDEDAWLLATKGMILSMLGRREEAEPLLRQSFSIDPALDRARQSLVAVLQLAGRYDEALRLLDEQLARVPQDAWTLATKGVILWTEPDRRKETVKLLRQAVAGDPDLTWAHQALAEALRVLDRYDEALSVLDELLVRNPQDAWALGTKGQVLLAQGDQDEAVKLLRQALTIDPSMDWARRSLAGALRLAGHNDEALPLLDDLLTRAPQDAWALATKGQALATRGDQDEAARLLRQALTIDPDMDWARRSLAEALRLGDQNDEALTVLDELLSGNPQDAWILATKGQVLSAQGDQDAAATLLRQALTINPQLEWARRSLAEALRLAGDNEEALKVLDELLGGNPQHAWALATKGQVLSAQGDQDAAATLLRQALTINPQLEWARHALAEVLRLAGHNDEALVLLDQALARNPDDAGMLTSKAAVLLDQGKYDEAAALLRGQAATSTSALLHAVLAEALRLLSEFDNALTECDRALALDPTDPAPWATKGVVLQAVLRHDEALEALDRAIGMDPHYSWALSAKAAVLIELAEFESTIELLDKAAQFGPVNEWTLSIRSVALRLLNRPAAALEACRQARELPESTAEILPVLAEALLGNGKQDEAAEQFRSYLNYQNDHGADPTPYTLGNTGWAHYRLGEYPEAIAILGEALSRDPQQVNSRFDMGLVFLCAGKAQLATSTYKTALDDLGLFTARRKHGLLYVAQFDFEDACVRYSPDNEVAAEIRDLLKECDYQATSDKQVTEDTTG
jgi:tetratricopeptide (TPR) repeat protein